MARRDEITVALTRGELDPDLSERVDLDHYFASLAKAPNCVFHPQGGVSDRGGSMLISDSDVLAAGIARRLRRRIRPVSITAGMITAANGGTPANLVDQNDATLFTTNIVSSNLFVLFEVDLGSEQVIDAIDLVKFSAASAGLDNAIRIEWWDGAAWQTFSQGLDGPAERSIRTKARTRRFAQWPGGDDGSPVTARYWRAVIVNASGITGAISIAGTRFWRETAALSPIRLRPVARSNDVSYELAITEWNIDVFRQQRYVASIPVSIPAQIIEELRFSGGFDTLIVYHEMLETIEIVRQGRDHEWNVGAAPFTNVPNLVAGLSFSGDADEIQDVTSPGLVASDQYVVALGGLFSAPLTYSNDATMATDIVTALKTLPGVATGPADVTASVLAAGKFRVSFGGANGSRSWPLVTILPQQGAAAHVPTQIVQAGLDADGKLFSAQTGWPRSGAILQSRQLVAGFRAGPTSYRFSQNPNLWNFGVSDPLLATDSFGGALDVEEVETILEVFSGRDLQIFTESGEWFAESRTLDATQPLNFRKSTGHGIARGVPVTLADGSTIFVQAGGQTARDYLWVEAEQSYDALALSILGPQVLTEVVDLARRTARSVRDGNLILMVNRDGTAAMLTLLREQRVQALAPWSTDGSYRSVLASIDHKLYQAVERDGENWLERWMPDRPLDWATREIASARTTQSCAYLDGRDDVWVIADNELIGPLTVSGGVVTLAEAASDITVGLAPAWSARLQEVRSKLQDGRPFRGPGRIFDCELSLKATGGVAVATNGGTPIPVPLTRSGERFEDGGPWQTEDGGAPQLPMFERLYTGNVTIEGLVGVDEHPYLELSRPLPAPVHIKSIRYGVAHNG